MELIDFKGELMSTDNINVTELAKDLFKNMPEYSITFQCLKWNTDTMEFQFYDDITEKLHHVNLNKIEKGIKSYLVAFEKDHQDYDMNQFNDSNFWDDVMVDKVIQITVVL